MLHCQHCMLNSGNYLREENYLRRSQFSRTFLKHLDLNYPVAAPGASGPQA